MKGVSAGVGKEVHIVHSRVVQKDKELFERGKLRRLHSIKPLEVALVVSDLSAQTITILWNPYDHMKCNLILGEKQPVYIITNSFYCLSTSCYLSKTCRQ
jgi:hypothetical protein